MTIQETQEKIIKVIRDKKNQEWEILDWKKEKRNYVLNFIKGKRK